MDIKRGDTEINHSSMIFNTPKAIFQLNWINLIGFYYNFQPEYEAGCYCVARWIIKPKQNATDNKV